MRPSTSLKDSALMRKRSLQRDDQDETLLTQNVALQFFDIASTASGQCWSMTSYCPVSGPVPAAPSNRQYAPVFVVGMMLTDLQLALHAAGSSGTYTPLSGDEPKKSMLALPAMAMLGWTSPASSCA